MLVLTAYITYTLLKLEYFMDIHTIRRATTAHDAITWNTDTNNTTSQYQTNNYHQNY